MTTACTPTLSAFSPVREEFAALHAAVTADWDPRDAYERRWVMELVACMMRQDHLRRLELAALAAAEQAGAPSEEMVRKLDSFARYGARIEKDLGRALQALRVLRDRAVVRIDMDRNDTREPGVADPSLRTCEPGTSAAACTFEPERQLNRQQRRALAAMRRKRAA